MKIQLNNSSERLFADLCSRYYLKGFVFHSPKYGDKLQYEAGDVVLWIRTQLIVFEIVWRDSSRAKSNSTKSFIKKIRDKRRQLLKDYEAFSSISKQIVMRNELNDEVDFNQENFHSKNFSGVIIIDSDQALEAINFLSYKATFSEPFPISILTKKDFIFLTCEADTIPDLLFYLKDRFNFIKSIFDNDCPKFLNLNNETEKDLIALYKMNDYTFPLDEWNESNNKKLWDIFVKEFEARIGARNLENEKSKIIDDIIDELRSKSEKNNSTVLHTWELSLFTRRARAIKMADKIGDALYQMQNGREFRYFAFYNELTECWLVFCFSYGGDSESFREKVIDHCKMKLFHEMNWKNFRYSIFGYGFRKSTLKTDNTFDEVFLCIEDANNYKELKIEELKRANKMFGHYKLGEVKEFPSDISY